MANITSKWPFTSMNADMLLHITIVQELFSTIRAIILFWCFKICCSWYLSKAVIWKTVHSRRCMFFLIWHTKLYWIKTYRKQKLMPLDKIFTNVQIITNMRSNSIQWMKTEYQFILKNIYSYKYDTKFNLINKSRMSDYLISLGIHNHFEHRN